MNHLLSSLPLPTQIAFIFKLDYHQPTKAVYPQKLSTRDIDYKSSLIFLSGFPDLHQESEEMHQPQPQSFPATELLYLTYEGNFITECQSKVLNVQQDAAEKVFHVVLDQTVLHAQGGGQPTDFGTLREIGSGRAMIVNKVTVDRESGIVTHAGLVDGDAIGEGEPFIVGDSVRVSVDEARRVILSECHSAGHVVDAAMARCGRHFKPSKAYHFLDGPYVEYEGTVPPDEREELIRDLQLAFCQLVEEDIPTKIDLMPKDQADALCNRLAKNFDLEVFADKRTGQVRLVTVAGFPCPCGGTHIRSTAELKSRNWGVTGIKCKKGVVRVKYDQNHA